MNNSSYLRISIEKKFRYICRSLTITGRELPPQVLQTVTHFSRKQEKGTIDVWWLYDDGGFTILLPYIISTRSTWANCHLRVFALANRNHELELEERKLVYTFASYRHSEFCRTTENPTRFYRAPDRPTSIIFVLLGN